MSSSHPFPAGARLFARQLPSPLTSAGLLQPPGTNETHPANDLLSTFDRMTSFNPASCSFFSARAESSNAGQSPTELPKAEAEAGH